MGLVLGRRGRCNQSGVHHSAAFEQQALLNEDVVDHTQNHCEQLVFFQPVAKAQGGALVGEASKLLKQRKFLVHRRVNERLFHGSVGQRELLLHEVHPQLRFEEKTAADLCGLPGSTEQ